MLTDAGDLDEIVFLFVNKTDCEHICFLLFRNVCCCKIIPQLGWVLSYQLYRAYQAYYRHIQSYPYADQV